MYLKRGASQIDGEETQVASGEIVSVFTLKESDPIGSYDLVIKNLDGLEGMKSDAFVVQE